MSAFAVLAFAVLAFADLYDEHADVRNSCGRVREDPEEQWHPYSWRYSRVFWYRLSCSVDIN